MVAPASSPVARATAGESRERGTARASTRPDESRNATFGCPLRPQGAPERLVKPSGVYVVPPAPWHPPRVTWRSEIRQGRAAMTDVVVPVVVEVVVGIGPAVGAAVPAGPATGSSEDPSSPTPAAIATRRTTPTTAPVSRSILRFCTRRNATARDRHIRGGAMNGGPAGAKLSRSSLELFANQAAPLPGRCRSDRGGATTRRTHGGRRWGRRSGPESGSGTTLAAREARR